jgi:predicted RNase H-like nuclease (RuvC/YqgF family)
LADSTKHDVLFNDILNIESQILVLRNNFRDALERNRELEGYLNELKRENLELKQKISEIEEQLQNQDLNSFSSLNLKEKEALKIKLQNLISRIDYHLSS